MADRPRWLLALACGLFLLDVVKHAWLMLAGPMQPWPDSTYYWQLGRDAAAGDVWLWESATAARTPMYPWFLAGCLSIGGTHALWLAVILQHVLEVAASVLTAATVWNATRSYRAALLAYGLCLPLTARCLFANSLLTETWATFLLALLMWLFSRCLTSGGKTSLWLAAIVLGVSLLLRPAAAAFLPALVFVAWQSGQGRCNRRSQIARATAALILCAAVTAPWCWRNQRLWNRYTVSVMLGRQLWTASFSPWTGANLEIPFTDAGRRIRTATNLPEPKLQHNWSVYPALTRAGLSELEADDLMRTASLEAIARNPGRAAFCLGARCVSFWYVKDWEVAEAVYPSQSPWQDQLGWSSPQRKEFLRRALRYTPERSFYAIWLWSAATWIGVAAMLWSAPHRNLGMSLAGLLLGLTLLTAILEIPLYRYRCVLEPVMIAAIVAGAHATIFWRSKCLQGVSE